MWMTLLIAVAAVAQILQWVETSHVLPQSVSYLVAHTTILSGIFNLSLLILLAVGMRKILELEKWRREIPEPLEVAKRVYSLETRTLGA
jgi:hypothetical protein